MPEEIQGESGGVMNWAAGVVANVYNAVKEGGQIQAAGRQGIDELGAALKAFPDAIQMDEPGTAFNPLYRNMEGEPPSPGVLVVAETAAPLPSPSEIAQAEQPRGSVHGEALEASTQPLPSPSEIANDPTPYAPPQDQGNVHGQEMGREM
ncbi:hypothetical protein [Singulisphaera acidiphila]|uniref:Uncharacterized protein n=1 Tax=Singulisphaera acidiphila (strain ATCC BAA-1392 / DSM 18658 / VKM B-2454 / MOB10) TaxID=886293 RepID=L0DRS3_SINAD|nr:hypothetical protein [Singulisphaera acidiphila]AGA31695.1 hypothetical protein Sinac_7666 [Singulisphaera acidiphila DSM 18658]